MLPRAVVLNFSMADAEAMPIILKLKNPVKSNVEVIEG